MASPSSSSASCPVHCPPPRLCGCLDCEERWWRLSFVARAIRIIPNPFLAMNDEITSANVVPEQRDLFRRLARLLGEGIRRTGAESWAVRRDVWDALTKP